MGYLLVSPGGERVRGWIIGLGKGGRYAFFSENFQPVEGLSVVEKFGAKGLDAVAGFFLFGGDELFLGHFGIVVDGAGEGG